MTCFKTVNLHKDGSTNLPSFWRILYKCEVTCDRDSEGFRKRSGDQEFESQRRDNQIFCYIFVFSLTSGKRFQTDETRCAENKPKSRP